MLKLKRQIIANKWEILLVIGLLIISGLAHAWNMFHFPYYESDEGTYMAQAWSVATEGKLAPYTYWYDHAPAGWLFIALWAKLTGGFFTFGMSVNSGRVFILILHLLSTLFLYLIAKRLTNSKVASVVCVLVFSLSPLGIFFQRRVLLDNIMVFWLLTSLLLLLNYRKKLRMVILSAIAFGFALLTKEVAIFFLPVFIYIIYKTAHKKNRKMAIFKWLAIVGAIGLLYVLYALLKGELFPSGSILGSTTEHVSLIETLKFQAERGSSSGLLDSSNGDTFLYNLKIWLRDDPIIIISGIVATLVCLAAGVKNTTARVVGLLSLSYWIFLIRGGLIIEFYVIPLLPFIALSIGCSAWVIANLFKKHIKQKNISRILYSSVYAIFITIPIVGFMVFSNEIRNLNLFQSDQTLPQRQALEWTLSQNNNTQFYAIDMYGYVDLQSKNINNFKYAEYYWKVSEDPDVRKKILLNDYKNIDFIAATPQMERDVVGGLEFIGSVLSSATPVIRFWNDGWGVQIWATKNPKQILGSSWMDYKNRFIHEGRVTDPNGDPETTSEGQSYALLRSVWADDKTTFDLTWKWTKANLQRKDGLLLWKWQPGGVADNGAATDADEDTALALLMAYKKWGSQTYLDEGKRIVQAIWDKEIVIVEGTHIVSAGDWANQESQVIVNPSYLSPANYRIFAKVDTSHQWDKVADSSYDILHKCTVAKLDKSIGVLPPEWCAINKSTTAAEVPRSPQPSASEYSYNAFRTPWRVALDWEWNKNSKAKEYLKMLEFLDNQWKSQEKLMAAYQHDGKPWENYESTAAYAANLGYFNVLHPDEAKNIYSKKVLSKFYQGVDHAYWDDPENYYTQNWAWFGTALYSDQLINYWTEE